MTISPPKMLNFILNFVFKLLLVAHKRLPNIARNEQVLFDLAAGSKYTPLHMKRSETALHMDR